MYVCVCVCRQVQGYVCAHMLQDYYKMLATLVQFSQSLLITV